MVLMQHSLLNGHQVDEENTTRKHHLSSDLLLEACRLPKDFQASSSGVSGGVDTLLLPLHGMTAS